MTATTHPLFGSLVEAVSFKRLSGRLYLVVGLPDGSPGTIPAAATSVFGDAAAAEDGASVLTVEGVRRLQTLVATLSSQRGSGRKRK